jgi:hypothetical protein
MLKIKLFSALVLTAAMGTAQAAGIPADILFDGYCDGLSGLTKNGDGVGGSWTNLDCAGASALVGGAQGKANNVGKGYIMGSQGLGPVYGFEVVWVVTKAKTWVIYTMDGSVLNAGTWSAAAEGAVRGSKSTLDK